ncbi:hypothetical protein ZEAMMB73_Zm00001d027239 [Zea mays]|uniref:Uncharacterized protein n=1 Tax=Zea mays TaxID=4577 RepID=A0A1D6JJ79_MAIZE|nr:hypothetical protein ZEAMMB73_Zm00001d027239 [Zea mays]
MDPCMSFFFPRCTLHKTLIQVIITKGLQHQKEQKIQGLQEQIIPFPLLLRSDKLTSEQLLLFA